MPSPGVGFLSIEGMVFRHGPGTRAHPFDRPFPAVVPGDGDTLRRGGHDFQLVAGFQAEVLDQCLGQPDSQAVAPFRDMSWTTRRMELHTGSAGPPNAR